MTRSGKRQGVILRFTKYSALALALGLAFFTAQSAQAQTFNVLHDFAGADGASPYAGVLVGAAGTIYGTTSAGGAANLGTVFKIDAAGHLSTLHSFTGSPDGATPYGGLIFDPAGNLYGTTAAGGAANLGTVFRLDTSGHLSLLHSFAGGLDGSTPEAGLVRDNSGNVYGTTVVGGSSGWGTVFKIDEIGDESVLYNFTLGADGGIPTGPLVRDSSGNLYGATNDGGIPNACFVGRFGCGVVFKLDSSGNETVLYTFTGGLDGGEPLYGALVRDSSGNLYGTTAAGGSADNGVIFKVDTSGTETVLHTFTNHGAFPAAGLVLDAAGNLYGTTENGEMGFGIVYKLDPAGNITVLHAFSGGADGANPYSTLAADPAGNLIGTTFAGGASNLGTVFGVFTLDFEFGSITTAPENATVAAGASVTYTIPVVSIGSFTGTVTLACTSGLPAKAQCSEASATTSTPAMLTISTTASSLAPSAPSGRRNPLLPLTTGLAIVVACMLALLRLRRQNWPFRRLVFACSLTVLAALIALAGCSGGAGDSGGGGGISGTPSGTYVVTITGTSGLQSHETTVSLTVHP